MAVGAGSGESVGDAGRDAFISHSSTDAEAAATLVHALERQGQRCWVAPRDVPPGSEYAEAILEGIRTSRAFIVLLSDPAMQSLHVRRETERASNLGKPLLPVRLEDIEPYGPLEYFVGSTQRVDAFPHVRDGLPQITAAIAHLGADGGVDVDLGSGGGRSTTPVPPAASRNRRLLIVGAAAVAVVLIAVLAALSLTSSPSSTEATASSASTAPTTSEPPTTSTPSSSTSTTTTTPLPPVPLKPVGASGPPPATDGVDAAGNRTSYGYPNLWDGAMDTAWRTAGDATRDLVTFTFDGPIELRRVGLVPGYAKIDPVDGADRWQENRRILEVVWLLPTGEVRQTLDPGSRQMQSIEVPAQTVDAVTMRIEAVTSDGGRDFTAVSEVDFGRSP